MSLESKDGHGCTELWVRFVTQIRTHQSQCLYDLIGGFISSGFYLLP